MLVQRPTAVGERHPEQGSTSIQTLLWAPWLLAIALGGTQTAVYGWGYLVARHAADQAVQVARVDGGTAAAGRADAQVILTQAGRTSLARPRVQVVRGPQTATATITADPVRVIPLLPLPRIAVTAAAPVEGFQPPGGTP